MTLLGSIADTSKDGLISFAEFQAFEGLLCTPDALYKTAFQLFDTNGNGTVNYNEFCQVIKKTDLHAKIPFHLDGQFVQRYFGKVIFNLFIFLIFGNNFCNFFALFFDFRIKNGQSIMLNSLSFYTISMKSTQWKHSKVKIRMAPVTFRH